MINVLSVPTKETPPQLPLSDSWLLTCYLSNLAEDRVPYWQRLHYGNVVQEFLEWWGRQHQCNFLTFPAIASNMCQCESAFCDMREKYLNHSCEERELRAEYRSIVNAFLRFALALRPGD